MNIFNLVATLVMDDSDYRKKLKEDSAETKKDTEKTEGFNRKKLHSFLKIVAVIAAVTAAIVKLTKATMAYGNTVTQGATQTGMSTEAYQKWLLTAESVGATQSDLNSAMSSFSDLLKSASNGEADATIALDKLGLSYADFKSLSPEEQFKLIVEKLQEMTDGTEKTALAQALFGSSASALMPLLSDQSKSVDDLWNEFSSLGLVMSQDGVDASNALSNSTAMLKLQLDALGMKIIQSIMPEIQEFIDLVSFAVKQFQAMPDWLQKLIVVIGLLTAAIIALGIAWNAGFGWITLIVDAIGALIIAIMELWKNWDNVSKWFSDTWNTVANVFIAVGNNIVSWAKNAWDSIVSFFVKTGNAIADFFKNIWKGITDGFKAFVNFFIDGLNGIISGLDKIQFTIPNWVPKIGGNTYGIQIPLIPRLQKGEDFVPSDMFPAYLDYGERVLTRTQNEQYSALGGASGIETLINGLKGANTAKNAPSNNISVTVRIGEKEFKDYIYKVVNDSMAVKGLRNLRKVGGYND
jgi:phage-related protein